MKKTLVGLLVVLLAGGAWFAYRHFFGRKGPGESGGRSVEVQATSQDFVKTVLATGTVKPEVGAQVNVGARQSGKVEKLNAAIGDRVRKGQVLAVIEHEDLQAQVAQREAQLAYVRAQIEAVKSRLTADLGKADALIAQRHTEVETERRRLAAVTEQRQRELEAEQERLESIRQQRGGELKLARAQILESEASHTYAQKDVKRMQTLFDKGMLPEQTLDKAVTDENAARSRLHTTKEGLSLAQTRLDQDRAVQEEVVRKAEALRIHGVAVQEESVRKVEAALEVARQERASIEASAGAELQVLDASIPRLESEISESRIRLSYAEVKAPIDGVVGTITTQEGETVAAGFNAPTFVTVVDLSRLQVDAYVDEVDIGKVREGQSASFTVDAFPDTRFTGKVTAIYPTAILLDNVVYYDVVIAIDGEYEGRLRPEMTANVTIEIETRKDAVAIPVQALQRKAGSDMVTVRAGATEENREVEVGLENGELVEIRSGLAAGETVVYFEKVRPQRGGGEGRP